MSVAVGALLHAERTADPHVVRWIVRGHLPGPCLEPVRHARGAGSSPPFVARILDALPEIVAITVRADGLEEGDVLRVDIAIDDDRRWRDVAADLQRRVREAASLRWWPDDQAAIAVGLRPASAAPASLPSGPCRSCPRSSSSSSTCGRPPARPPAST